MHAIEKILARASGRESVSVGDIVNVNIDQAMVHDRAGPRVMELMKKYNLQHVAIPEKICVFFDHDAPSTKMESAAKQHEWRLFMKEYGIDNIFDVGSGVSHIVMPRKGMIRPGMVVVGSDSHTSTGGALGAATTGIGETEMTAVFTTGKIWLKVPPVVKIALRGSLGPKVGPKDISLRLLQMLGTGSLIYSAVEFCGDGLESLSVSDRMVLASMSIQMGAKFGYIAPDQKTFDFLTASGAKGFTPQYTDDGYAYREIYEIDLGDIPPLVAMPHGFDEILPVDDVASRSIPIDQAVIGSCTGGRIEDLHIAADVLRGRKVASGVRLIVTSGSREIYAEAVKDGTISILIDAGAAINVPRCGPCGSSCDGFLGPGEVCLTNANRNFKGRLGSPLASIYLASTYTVALSAARGYIADPRREDGGNQEVAPL